MIKRVGIGKLDPNRQYRIYRVSFDDFIVMKDTYVKSQASRCGLDEEEFTEKLLKAYEESLVQQVLI